MIFEILRKYLKQILLEKYDFCKKNKENKYFKSKIG